MNPTDFIRRAIQNSPWLVIAFLLHALLAAMFSIIYVAQHLEDKRRESITIARVEARPADPDSIVEPLQPPDRRSLPDDRDAEIVPFEVELYIPDADVQPDEDLHLEAGDLRSLDNLPSAPSGGTAIGPGAGPGHHGNRPSAYRERRLGEGGGPPGRGTDETEATETAVLDGLRWLLRHQNDDGSFGAASCGLHCTSVTPCVSPELGLNANHDEGLTGLALLCFLGAGWSSDSRQNIVDTQMGKRYFVGPTIKKGLLWLAQIQNGNGAFAVQEPNMYNQALATMAMCEAYALSGNKTWKGYAEKGLQFLVQAQKVNPKGTGLWGWRYGSRQDIEGGATGEAQGGNYAFELSDSDTSVTCWAAMALKSAELAEISFPAESYAGALGFVRWVSTEDGRAGYQDPQTAGMTVQGFRDFYQYHPGTMSALSMCVRTFVTKDISDPYLEAAAKQIIKDLPVVTQDKLSIDYYYWYYATLALNQFDGPDSPRSSGKYWKPWNEALVPVLLDLQDQTATKDDCSHGGWLTEDRWSYAGGPMYTTAISILTLEVYYRFANAFGTAKAEKKPAAPNQPEKK